MKKEQFTSDFLSEFQVYWRRFNHENTYGITQNNLSLSLLLKSILCDNSTLIYFTSFFNCFQNLETHTEKNLKAYSLCSHSITLFLLKILEKKKIIEIIYCEENGKFLLPEYFLAVGNQRKKETKWYGISFRKLRSFQQDDIDSLYNIMKILHINSNQVDFTNNANKLTCGINHLTLLKGLLQLKMFIRFVRQIYNYVDEAINEITSPSWELSRNRIK